VLYKFHLDRMTDRKGEYSHVRAQISIPTVCASKQSGASMRCLTTPTIRALVARGVSRRRSVGEADGAQAEGRIVRF